jgi:hypothetical protein
VCRETRGCWDQTETSIVQDMHFYLRFAGVQGNTGVLGSDRDLYCSGYALLFTVCWCVV